MLDVLMLYAVKLGPIETGEGSTTAYVGFTEAGALPPVLAGAAACHPAPPQPPPGESPPSTAPASPGRQTRIPWSELLLRVFREDVLQCPCGGRKVVLAFLTDAKVVKAILEHLGLRATGPPIAPARRHEQSEFTTWQDDVPELQQALR